jgi:L-ribulokinase
LPRHPAVDGIRDERERLHMENAFIIGIDFGTDSVRAIVTDTTGRIAATGVAAYPRWKEGRFCDPGQNQFRQHPLDYTESLETAVRLALAEAGPEVARRVRGLSIDTTGSTPVAVDRTGTPLALLAETKDDPDGMFILWKDHTAVAEAEEINAAGAAWNGERFLKYSGGVYSSEWFWAKILHVLRSNPLIRERAFSWVEHCDWISGLLCGRTDPLTLKRSRCAAGHKALWHESFGGLPPDVFFSSVDPLLGGLRERLFRHTHTSDQAMGVIAPDWALRLGLPAPTIVGVGAFDAHMGAVGGGIGPSLLSKVMGTSTCDMLVAPAADGEEKLISGICGQVDGSIIPGLLGLEAGQSAFGDVYAWFAELLSWPLKQTQSLGLSAPADPDGLSALIIRELSQAAGTIEPGESSLIALDWLNGRRTPFADQKLTAAVAGLSLGSTAPRIFRALVEATAFGARRIVECFTSQGVPIKGVIALGGVARKSGFVMQVMADVLGLEIKVARAEEACALGAAMFAATAAGLFPSVIEAQKSIGAGFEKTYSPDQSRAGVYAALYERYQKLGGFVESSLK